MGPQVNDKIVVKDDGTTLRTYSGDLKATVAAEKAAKSRVLAIMSILTFSTAGVLKYLFFGEQSEASDSGKGSDDHARPPLKPETELSNVLQLPLAGQTKVQPSSATEPLQAAGLQNLAVILPPSDGVLLFDDDERRGGGASLRSSNDNETLYRATPGSGVQLIDDSSTLSAKVPVSAPGPTGGPPLSTAPVPRDNDDPDSDGDDQNDDGTPTQPTNSRPFVTRSLVLDPILMNQAVIISIAGLLEHARDLDGDALDVVNLTSSSGSLVAWGDNSFLFTPVRDDTSDVLLTYSITDGELSVQQTAFLDILPVNAGAIIGTDHDDTIVGTPLSDTIAALGGNDIVLGRESDDVIYGGDGDDRIVGGDGSDAIFAGAGNDIVWAGAGNDTVQGGDGNDTLFGDGGRDYLSGDAGDDHVYGGDGDDVVVGGDGDDVVSGGDGNDIVLGGAGNDDLDGGAGDDLVAGDAGEDVAVGGEGNDRFTAIAGDGNDSYEGGAGIDTYDLSATSANAVVDLQAGRASSNEIGQDTLSSIENVVGGGGDDVYTGNARNNVISAGAGRDAIIARAGDGDDTYDGGAGIDTYDLSATSANAVVDLQAGRASSNEVGQDTLSSIENIVGGDGDDVYTGNAQNNVISAGAGSDTIVARAGDGDDTYDGGDGTDTYDLSETNADAIVDLYAGAASSSEVGDDSLVQVESAIGGSGNDTLVAGVGDGQLTGGSGEDYFVFVVSSSGSSDYSGRYRIMDFEVGDRIDLRDIDREIGEALDDLGWDRFSLISSGAEFDRPGQIRFSYDTLEENQITLLEVNLDSDPDVDFSFEVKGYVEVTSEDFERSSWSYLS